MCGIVGAYGPPGARHEWLETALVRLHHRGPDDRGVWREPAAGIGVAQTRLAIQDLSAAGRQPMVSDCGGYVLVFNGEIYNHLVLRAELPSRAWRGHSDTETVLACFAAWGVERTLQRTVGMFALALFATRERCLVLARDRFGEKPLYYGYAGAALVFASELKALRADPAFEGSIDREALADYMRHSYVPAPRSIYSQVRKLPAGCYLELPAAALAARAHPAPRQYWSATAVAIRGIEQPLNIDAREAVDELERLLERAVRGQLLADVPLGAFLSGGIDSSTIVALMQKGATQPVRTFSIGFDDCGFDESEHARAVAEHLRTEHSELKLHAADALALVPELPQVYDEPFADPSQLPTMLVARLARRHVTVALSGDAGDELFGGYNRYFVAARTWQRVSRVPLAMRRNLARGLRAIRPATWDRCAAWANVLRRRERQWRMAGDRVHKIAGVLQAGDSDELYARLVSQWWDEPVVQGAMQRQQPPSHAGMVTELTQRMMLMDTVTYLPDDILVKVDRAAMAASLETRIPFLDHRLYEFVWRLRLPLKVRNGTGKWLLRQLLYRYVPAQLVERPKMGFGVPLASWLRGPLRDWAEQLLSESRLRSAGLLNAAEIRRHWSEHLTGQRNWQYQLWNVLMFEAWREAQRCAG
jgi:asparagine synthase (glutamine-hydrolysing)